MHICLISQEYPPETNWGGIATYTRILAKRLTEMGHRVHVISGAATGIETEVNDGLVVVHRVNTRPKSRWAYWLNNKYFQFQPILNLSFRMAEKIAEIHREGPIDIIEAPESCAQAIVTTLFQKNIPVVTRLHTPNFLIRERNNIHTTSMHRRRDLLEWLQTRSSSGVTSPSRALADRIQKRWGIKQVDILPNFFDLNGYEPDVSAYKKQLEGTDYILFFGKLQILKGPQVLSKTIPGLLKTFSNLKVVFVGGDFPFGSGSMKSYIESENRKYIENLIFLDNIPQNLLFPMIEHARLIILPSLWENFPYACLEAMSFGKTVIGTRRTGFEEIIEDGVSGILVDPGSPEHLEKAALSALQSMDLEEMGQRAKKRAAEFSSDKVVPRILEYYNQIVRKVA